MTSKETKLLLLKTLSKRPLNRALAKELIEKIMNLTYSEAYNEGWKDAVWHEVREDIEK